MKALDPGLPRQVLMDLAIALCGKDKSISYANMLDFLDKRMIQQHFQGRSGSEQGSISPRSNVNDSVDISYRSNYQNQQRSLQ